METGILWRSECYWRQSDSDCHPLLVSYLDYYSNQSALDFPPRMGYYSALSMGTLSPEKLEIGSRFRMEYHWELLMEHVSPKDWYWETLKEFQKSEYC